MAEENFSVACLVDVLFFDTVGFTEKSEDAQLAVVKRLKQIVLEVPLVREKRDAGELSLLPTGDGMAMAFFADAAGPLRTAIEVSLRLRAYPEFKVRMGLHSGAGYRYPDVNDMRNVTGEAVNVAHRIMEFGDGGDILLSQEAVQRVREALAEKVAGLSDLGRASAKHDLPLQIYRFHGDGVGNETVPARIRRDPTWQRPPGLWVGKHDRNPLLGAFQMLYWALFDREKWGAAVEAIHSDLPVDFGPLDLSWRLVWRSPEIRSVLLAAYVILPLFFSATVWLVYATGYQIPYHRAAAIGGVLLAAPVFSLAFGFGAGMIFCAFAGWGDLLRFCARATGLPGLEAAVLFLASLALALPLLNVLVLTKADEGSREPPRRSNAERLPGLPREAGSVVLGVVSNVLLAFPLSVLLLLLLSGGISALLKAAGVNVGEAARWDPVVAALSALGGAALVWSCLAGAITLRRGLWAHAGLFAGALAVAAFSALFLLQPKLSQPYVAGISMDPSAEPGRVVLELVGGTVTMVACRSLSYAFAEWIGGTVAAITAILLMDSVAYIIFHFKRNDWKVGLPALLLAAVLVHTLNRRRATGIIRAAQLAELKKAAPPLPAAATAGGS
jgi:class 3 adenylate cyclase